jgi:hypothetical protein
MPTPGRRCRGPLRDRIRLAALACFLVVAIVPFVTGAIQSSPVLTPAQAGHAAFTEIRSLGLPASSFRAYQVLDVQFEPHPTHVHDRFGNSFSETCGDARPDWLCPAPPAWLVTVAAPPQSGYTKIEGSALIALFGGRPLGGVMGASR